MLWISYMLFVYVVIKKTWTLPVYNYSNDDDDNNNLLKIIINFLKSERNEGKSNLGLWSIACKLICVV